MVSSNAGLSALRRAVVVDMGRTARGSGGAAAVAVRYTGLVGAIDSHLDTVVSWDKADTVLRLGGDGGGGDGRFDAPSSFARGGQDQVYSEGCR